MLTSPSNIVICAPVFVYSQRTHVVERHSFSRCLFVVCLIALHFVWDQLNDPGQQGWELTAVTDASDAKIFILKQPDEIIIDPFAQA